jgi:hypothetical protein
MCDKKEKNKRKIRENLIVIMHLLTVKRKNMCFN